MINDERRGRVSGAPGPHGERLLPMGDVHCLACQRRRDQRVVLEYAPMRSRTFEAGVGLTLVGVLLGGTSFALTAGPEEVALPIGAVVFYGVLALIGVLLLVLGRGKVDGWRCPACGGKRRQPRRPAGAAPAALESPTRAAGSEGAAGERAPLVAAPKRPSAPLVFGILSIIGGAFCSLGCLSFAMRGSNYVAAYEALALQHKLAGWRAAVESELTLLNVASHAAGAALVLMSVALLAVGVGLVRYQPWSQRGAKLWGWAALGLIVSNLVSTVLLEMPAAERLATQYMDIAPSGSLPPGDGLLMIFASGFYALMMLPLPILLAIFFRRRAPWCQAPRDESASG